MPHVTDVTPEPPAMTRAQRRRKLLQAKYGTPEPFAAPESAAQSRSSATPEFTAKPDSSATADPSATPDSPDSSPEPDSPDLSPEPDSPGSSAEPDSPDSSAKPDKSAKPKSPTLTRAQKRAAANAAAAVDPVPEMPLQPLVTIAVLALAGLVTISAFAGPVLVAVSVALAAGVMAWGWPGLLALPSPRGSTFVLAVGSAAAIGTVLATKSDPYLNWMPAALACSMLIAFLHQLARRDGRPRLVESIASTITALAIVVSGASLVALPLTPEGDWVVAISASAMAASALTDLVGGSRRLRAWLLPLAMLAGGAVAIVVGITLADVGWGAAALLGVLAAGISHATRRALAMLPSISAARSQLVSASASVLTGGLVIYVVGRYFLG